MMKPEVIRYQHIRNILEREYLEAMGKKLFGDKFFGFVQEITFMHSEGFMTRKIIPMEGTPAQEFRKSIERAGLVGKKFNFDSEEKDKPIIRKDVMLASDLWLECEAKGWDRGDFWDKEIAHHKEDTFLMVERLCNPEEDEKLLTIKEVTEDMIEKSIGKGTEKKK